MTLQLDVFLSWSGDVSRSVAEALAKFIRHVVPGVDIFVSSQDISAGERWMTRLEGQLEGQHHAILCLTSHNQGSPWINYEAGAIAKVVSHARVIPYTIGFSPREMESGPLTGFQAVANDKPGTWKLVQSLNSSLPKPHKPEFLQEGFDMWWPGFEQQMSDTTHDAALPIKHGPTERDLLIEIRQDVQQLLTLANRAGTIDVSTALEIVGEALRDRLTRLANRRAFAQRGSELAAANVSYVIAMLDLDYFKRVNDTEGHAKGDVLLTKVAAAMRTELKSADLLARVGGGEFGVIFLNATPDKVAGSISTFLTELPKILERDGFSPTTATAGVSTDRSESFDTKLRDADMAMYQAKGQQRGTVRIAD